MCDAGAFVCVRSASVRVTSKYNTNENTIRPILVTVTIIA